MKIYTFEITETRKKVVQRLARNQGDAEDALVSQYGDGDLELGSEDIDRTSFECIEIEEL